MRYHKIFAFQALEDIYTILKSYWGYSTFRPLQEEIIHSVLEGRDTLAIMPTGGGKSVCFQVPAIAQEGICLVVTPLIALMKDQVEKLRAKGISSLLVHSGMNYNEVRNALNSARHGGSKFLYVSPERLQTELFKEYLPALPLNLIAVDEAHCISQWGYDFRPAYLRIADLREEKPEVPVLALTASATAIVQDDIRDKLKFSGQRLFRQSYERANLSYSAFNVDVKIDKLLNIVKKVTGCGIVYCRSRRRTVEIASLLQLNKISADFYHAGLSHEDRNEKQENWIKDKTRIMVCTNAFGMGIDKPDVRFVVHADIPECIESYYQEAGRAGRDGQKAYAVLLYRTDDLEALKEIPGYRFPPLTEIRKIYQSLVNYLQLPAGAGDGISFDFDIEDFSKNFQVPALQVMYVIKTLEQESVLTYNDQFFNPSTVMVTCSREYLQEVEAANPLLEPYIRFLLRSYGGILDVPVAISEKTMAKTLRKEVAEVQNTLLRLQAMAVLSYQPRKETPQIRFLSARVPADDLVINENNYRLRKEVLENQVETILAYAMDTACCRALFIGQYFNDHQLKPCGVCDNCLQKQKINISNEEHQALYNSVISELENKCLTIKELQAVISPGDINISKLWKVVELLIAEDLIEMIPAAGTVKLGQKKRAKDKNPARF
ncbi:MAG: RecQ family ATP-dependent DNA helicase [Chitinophagaceae bacterium]|nr:RecQ family ATP-dependent DNA helicase [Chitinophagaceae bacterium]MCW5925407.1 RecQ family ATP-dependent DNA helicase [Chitinophagaceae bacterium]